MLTATMTDEMIWSMYDVDVDVFVPVSLFLSPVSRAASPLCRLLLSSPLALGVHLYGRCYKQQCDSRQRDNNRYSSHVQRSDMQGYKVTGHMSCHVMSCIMCDV